MGQYSLAELKAIVDFSTKEAAGEVRLSMRLRQVHGLFLGEEPSQHLQHTLSEKALEQFQTLKDNNWKVRNAFFYTVFSASEVQDITLAFMKEAAEKTRLRAELRRPLTSEQDAYAIRLKLMSIREEKKDRKDQHRQFRAWRKEKKRTWPQYAPPLYPPELRRLPNFHNNPEVSNDTYESLYQISTAVCIFGKWYRARVDQSRDSVIDTRLLQKYSIEDQKVQPKHPNSGLFSSPYWMDYHSKRSHVLPLTFETILQPWEYD